MAPAYATALAGHDWVAPQEPELSRRSRGVEELGPVVRDRVLPHADGSQDDDVARVLDEAQAAQFLEDALSKCTLAVLSQRSTTMSGSSQSRRGDADAFSSQ